MHTKLIGFGIGITLLVAPLFAVAQTSSTDNSSVIASLEQLIVTLTQELQQLLAARSQSPSGTVSAGTNTRPSGCDAYTNLQKGDADASTNGLVSQLQSFLGMPNVTGYYGAQTAIAYQNKCSNLGNAQPTSVAGMSKYTDSNFGFSFWYPSGWNVQETDAASALTVTNQTNTIIFHIDELTPTNGHISNWIDNLDSEAYYFDSNAAGWMYSRTSGSTVTRSPADVSSNTMGGLHVLSFPDEAQQSDAIVPLSATKFVTIDTTGNTSVLPLIQTIVATNPAVAIPVSTSNQIVVIQAEASAYGVQSSNTSVQTSSLQTYTNTQYGFIVQYNPSSFSTQPPSVIPYMGYPTIPNSLFTLYYEGGANIAGFSGADVTFAASGAATYEDCINQNSSTKQTSIHGITFYHETSGDAGLGHFSDTDTYRTYYNGACYEIVTQIDTSRVEDGLMAADTSSVSSALNDVIETMSFTSPNSAAVLHASAPPAWSTFVGTQTPVSFTYPGSFSTKESEDESDVGPGIKSGVETQVNSMGGGAIAVQMTPSKFFGNYKATTAQTAMQVSMQQDPVGGPSHVYTSLTLGGEPAFASVDSTGAGVVYVAHGNEFFRILLWKSLVPQEYQNFISSFKFTQ